MKHPDDLSAPERASMSDTERVSRRGFLQTTGAAFLLTTLDRLTPDHARRITERMAAPVARASSATAMPAMPGIPRMDHSQMPGMKMPAMPKP